MFKIKVGRDLQDDIRRCRIVREEIGPDRRMMIDANCGTDQAIEWVRALAEFQPWFIEEPTSPDDVLGHARIAKAVAPSAWRPERCARTG
ncbi:MAG: enolase C-terminal domain-like protein [Planctomycetaceae bacterium]